jgi:L-asparaginase
VTRIVVLSTGGTIASRYSAKHGSIVSNVGGGELVASLGSLAPEVNVVSEEFSNLGSYGIDMETLFRLAQRLQTLLRDPSITGVFVTHGTDTMEESAYLADLLIDSAKPVVFTGAQLHADEPDSDGPRNLADAIRMASCEDAVGLGVVIAFGQEIHAARDATKMHASRVDVVKLVMGSDNRFVRAALETGTRGIVLEAFGRGNATPAVTKAALEAIQRGIPVAVTSRSPQGRVAPVYGAGGGSDLAGAGAIFCGDLSAVKARVLMALLLGSGADQPALRRAMELHGN